MNETSHPTTVFQANVLSHGMNSSLLNNSTPAYSSPPANSGQHNILSNSSVQSSDACKPCATTCGDVRSSALLTSNKYVKLNVGGSLHYTTMGTLTKEDNMLRAMFSGRMVVLTDSEGWILIDRCGKHFSAILNYLRDGSVALPDNRCEIAELLSEAKYYLIRELVTQCETALAKKAMDADPICRVPIITSQKEEQDLVKKCSRPIVKFMHNRCNNKYSYTNSSDDNMLRNIELFDKLSLRFNGRILFIKDIIGDEICVWSFYGHKRKVAEICCTSIVYATEKKQTKVEFPEARIYEETLNILLYEPNSGSTPIVAHTDNNTEIIRSGHNCQSDEDAEESSRTHRVRMIHVNSSNRPA